MISTGIIYLLFANFFLSAYNIGVKRFEERLILLLWAATLSYVGYVGYALFHEKVLLLGPHPWKKIMFDYTFINIPFYCAIGIFSFLSLFLYAYLLKHHDISLVTPILKIGMLIQTFGYFILGQKFHLFSFLGVLIVSFGSLLSVWPSNIKKLDDFKKQFPFDLVFFAIVAAGLKAANKILVFLVTQQTPVTLQVQKFLDYVFHHLHPLTLTFVNPFDYNIGVRFFIVASFLTYIIGIKREGHKILAVLCEHFKMVVIISCCFLGYLTLYYNAYGIIQNKVMISPLLKLSLPLILFASYYLLGEKITTQKLVGYAIIIGGAIVTIL